MRSALAACRSAAAVAVTAALAVLGLAGSPTASAASAATADVLHVAPAGHGDRCGPQDPCSLTAARDRARALVPHAAGDVVVELAGGTYRLTAPLKLGPQDSGRPGHPVVYRAAPGQQPVLSGATRVTGFTEVDAAKHIYRADVPPGTTGRVLFVNGVRAERDRGPRNPGGFSVTSTGFTTGDPSYASWTDPARVEVVQDNGWKQMRCPLAGISRSASGGSDLTVDPGCWTNNHTSVPNPGFPLNGAGLPTLDGISWLENAYQLLGTPGQFYLDQDAGHLYYVPRPGEDLATADVELPLTTELFDASGTPGHLAPLNDSDWRATYSGSWSTSGGRHLGDLGDDVHYTSTDGDSVSYAFDGTGIQVLSETNSDEGTADVYIDGTKRATVSGSGPERLAQQVLASVTGLAKGPHTLKLVKTGGSFLLVDGFTVIPDAIAPVHDISVQGLTFAYTAWNTPTAAGYVDNQAGVLWDPTTRTPVKIPAAVQVHRGLRVDFSQDTVRDTGTSGIALADQTQDSAVDASTVTDTSGVGVAIGEVDDYYQTDPALMTSGDTVSDSVVQFPGQEYSDAVGIWVGHARGTLLSHNDVGYTPYSGISLGWGWGWASSCTLQAKQGLPDPCRHGTTYGGGNRIIGNHVHSVMGALFDGGPVYTLGGQSAPSEFAGNVLSECIDGCNMIYHDEGSSQWDTHDNVIRFGGGSQWLSLWTPTIHDDRIHDNFSDTAAYSNNGTDVDVEQATVVTDGNWPPAAQAVIAAAGPDRAPGAVADDDDLRVAYRGSWSFSGSRGLGDLDDGVHYTQSDGASATFSFTGTGASFVTETNGDEGPVDVTVDGTDKGTVDAATPERHTRQTLYSVTGLPPGPHTLTVTKRGGTYLLVDGFTVAGSGSSQVAGYEEPGGSVQTSGSERMAGYEEPGAFRQAAGPGQVNASRQAVGYEQAGSSRGAAGARTVAGAASRVSAWSPSMTIGGPNFDDRTLRMVVHPSVGGSSLRIHLSNLRSTTPLAVGEVRIALQATQATARPGTEHQVTFGHKAAVTIPAGGELVSDPIPLTVAAEQNLLVSLYLPQATSSATWHSDAFDTTYLSAPGDHTADTGDGNYVASTTSWYYLSGLDVVPSTARGTVVAFGDSITDGYNTPTGAYHRWPDDLARRLAAAGNPKAVVDAGIGGNRVLTDVPNIWQGVSATKRFAHDALAQPGVKDVILLEGINDIGNNAGPGGAPLTVQDLTDGYRTLIAQAHAAGVRVIGATLLPDKGNVYYSEAAEAMRESVNTWIRTSGAFDGVVDFAAAAASPTDPTTLNPAFDSGDHLHPNESGMQALANAVDLSLLR